MSRHLMLLGVPLAMAVAGDAAAQVRTEARAYTVPGRAFSFSTSNDDGDRAVIGITTSTGSARDTLGVLISSVYQGGPADKAGIEEGSRVVSVNGVNLKLAAADVGDMDMSGQMTRRLTRELGKVKAGDEVELKVYTAGQTKTIKIKTVAADDLYDSVRRNTVRSRDDDRAALGVSLGSSGSKRDTLGVLLVSVDDGGPAGKAGLEEGNRVQSINGVDLRVGKDDAGDEFVSGSKVRRLQRELEKVKAGDEVSLKVYIGAGRTRDVKVKTVPMSDLPHRGFSIFGGSSMAMPMPPMEPMTPMAPMPPMIELRRNIEDAVREPLARLAPAIRRTISNRIII
ncbi:MAG TPA: PDZ domain-containing protein [Gemmatimonadaceae bacterium]